MDARFDVNPVAGGDTDDPSGTTENATTPGSPIAGVVAASPEGKTASSPKRRRAVLKRVVMVPIADVEGSRLKGEAAPPSDSWAWRKYGQKPIKGSPYPRGYYRCSSSKGCPARKQVERSRVDPTMLVVTYACDHNHPWPTSRSSSSPAPDAAAAAGATSAAPSSEPASAAAFSSPSTGDDDKFATDLGGMAPDNVLLSDEFSWFTDDNSPSSLARGDTILHSPICATAVAGEADTVMFTMGEEDESLFADLGELPECSVVFRRGEESRLRGLAAAAPWCGSTG